MAISVETDIPTKYGFVKASDIKVGDVVYDINGNETQIESIKYESLDMSITIRFGRAESIVLSQNQIIPVYVDPNKVTEYISAEDVFSMCCKGWNAKFPSVTIKGNGAMSINPWMLGFWLGDGCHRSANVYTCIDDLEYVKKRILASGYLIGAIRRDRRFNQKGVSVSVTKGLLQQLKQYNIYMNKHMPDEVYSTDINYRREVIKGLVDSDGMVEKSRGRALFTNTNYDLALGCARILSSLGELVCIYPNTCHGFGKTVVCYVVTWMPIELPAGMPRKAGRVRQRKIIEKRTCRHVEFNISYSGTPGVNFTTTSGSMAISNFYIPIGTGKTPEISRETANKLFRTKATCPIYTKDKERIAHQINSISPVRYKVQEITKDRRINDWNKKRFLIDGCEYKGYRDAARAVGCSEHTVQRAIAAGRKIVWGHNISLV